MQVRETVPTFDDFRSADEAVMAGSMPKVMPIAEEDGAHCQIGPVTRRMREICRDRAHS